MPNTPKHNRGTAASNHIERNDQICIPSTRLLTEEQTAQYLGFSRSYLRQARMNGHLTGRMAAPPYLKLGRTVRYDKSDLDAWIDQLRKEEGQNGES